MFHICEAMKFNQNRFVERAYGTKLTRYYLAEHQTLCYTFVFVQFAAAPQSQYEPEINEKPNMNFSVSLSLSFLSLLWKICFLFHFPFAISFVARKRRNV